MLFSLEYDTISLCPIRRYLINLAYSSPFTLGIVVPLLYYCDELDYVAVNVIIVCGFVIC